MAQVGGCSSAVLSRQGGRMLVQFTAASGELAAGGSRSFSVGDRVARSGEVSGEMLATAVARGGGWQQRRGRHQGRGRDSGNRRWQDWRATEQSLVGHYAHAGASREQRSGSGALVVVGDMGGQYEESLKDVDQHLEDYLTFKAVRTVLAQLAETNPVVYQWFHNFAASNRPQDSRYFLRVLVKENQELGERVMVTRLVLFQKWTKHHNAATFHQHIRDRNLEIMRERLMQTVKLDGDDDVKKPIPQA